MKLNFKISVLFWLNRIILWLSLQYHRLLFGCDARFIYIAKLRFAVVDSADYDFLRSFKWRLSRSDRTYYAFTTVPRPRPLYPRVIWMHHLVLQPPRGLLIDHRNHNGLDNRPGNLRLATHIENNRNMRKQKPKSTSRYKGVDRVKATGKYRARIAVAGHRLFLGSFNDELSAAKAYDQAAVKYFGEFACLNFK
jgi:hypothetical protein